ncbi:MULTISPECIES: ABC transporter permease [Methylomicrobium]|uniref:ABC-type antimicrobial peptide transport system, permease component n=1 Tax=Methylomicrobium album BG8 TaxID=686340 RepID=H8GH31_METAL|nr:MULTISPECIES: ABC transporter permease [Methylomicrobium]EIC31306.1 ABC-type antimicrobial peptide transport system, permease component [Methylomicrobium album BG8]
MRIPDLLHFSYGSIVSHKLRSSLTALGLVIGIAAVVILTSIGRGVHTFVLAEFTQFGTHLLSVNPGKKSTFGISGATISTVRPLSLDDAAALRKLPPVLAVVPVVQGNARVEAGSKQRRTNVLGVGSAVPEVWRLKVATGRFLPDDEGNPRALAVLGDKLAQELFGAAGPQGQRIRIGTDRYRVIGVMRKKGQMLGFDMDDTLYIPAAKALELFDREGLMEIDVLYKSSVSVASVQRAVKKLMTARHGFEDFTIITQNQMLETMDSVLSILTLGVAALGGISLLVGSVGILTIMTIAVSERISEIGLLRAVGAERRVIFRLFLSEALALSVAGGLAGVLAGILVIEAIDYALPALPVELAWGYILSAFAVSVLIGIAAGVAPAIKASRLEPLEALRTE